MEVFNWIQLVLSTNGDFHIERGNWKQKLNGGVALVTIVHRVWFKILAAIRDFNETKLKRLDWFTFSLFKWTWSIYLCFGKINARYWVGIHRVGIFLVGIYQVGIHRGGDLFRWEFSGWEFTRGEFSRGEFTGWEFSRGEFSGHHKLQ